MTPSHVLHFVPDYDVHLRLRQSPRLCAEKDIAEERERHRIDIGIVDIHAVDAPQLLGTSLKP